MDPSRFDALARALAAGATRRGLLGAALAAALAPLAAAGRGPSAEGPCGPNPERNACKRDGDCCTGLCNKGEGRCPRSSPAGRTPTAASAPRTGR
jgi:hypothetical protein